MSNKLPFVDVLAVENAQRRQKKFGNKDLASFEYTYEAEITNVYAFADSYKFYQIQISDPERRNNFHFKPGQFIMLELPGIGEAPFSICSSPTRSGDIELCIRRIGNLTGFLDRLSRGTQVGISGPFGTHFPIESMYGKNIFLIAGGLGIVPLRSPLLSVLENRSRFGQVEVIYGARHPSDLLFAYQYEEWRQFDINLNITVEHANQKWQGPTGLITTILSERIMKAQSLADNTYAVVCGPPVMFRFVCDILTAAGLPMQKMFVSLERRMHCGRGKCCRCNIGSTYTCLDGPVFDYWSVMNLKEAI